MDQEFLNFKKSLEYMDSTELHIEKSTLNETILKYNMKLKAVEEQILLVSKSKNVELGVSSVESEEVVKFR